MKEDLVFYGKVKDADSTGGLSEEQLKDLKALSQEDEMKDTHSPDEFKKTTDQLRTK